MRPIKSARDRTSSREQGGGGAWIRVENTADDEIREEARNTPSRVNESTLKTIRARHQDDTLEKYRRPPGLTARASCRDVAHAQCRPNVNAITT